LAIPNDEKKADNRRNFDSYKDDELYSCTCDSVAYEIHRSVLQHQVIDDTYLIHVITFVHIFVATWGQKLLGFEPRILGSLATKPYLPINDNGVT